MKKSLPFALLLFIFPLCSLAQPRDEPIRNLSEEEIHLVQAYRRDPEPFRRLLYERYGHEEHRHPQRPHGMPPLGPRDILDVMIEGGSVVFYGHNYAYDPVSFRITRGEEIEVVFRRQRSSIETRVIVAYRADGLHFDVPEQRVGTQGQERGYFILGEDARWDKGDAIEMREKINGGRSRSRADHLTFHIRYALAR